MTCKHCKEKELSDQYNKSRQYNEQPEPDPYDVIKEKDLKIERQASELKVCYLSIQEKDERIEGLIEQVSILKTQAQNYEKKLFNQKVMLQNEIEQLQEKLKAFEWRPIDELDRPYEDQGVLITDGDIVSTGHYYGEYDKWYVHIFPDEYNLYDMSPTHYMEKPTPPKEDEE